MNFEELCNKLGGCISLSPWFVEWIMSRIVFFVLFVIKYFCIQIRKTTITSMQQQVHMTSILPRHMNNSVMFCDLIVIIF